MNFINLPLKRSSKRMGAYNIMTLYLVLGIIVGMTVQSWKWGGIVAVGAVIGFICAEIIG